MGRQHASEMKTHTHTHTPLPKRRSELWEYTPMYRRSRVWCEGERRLAGQAHSPLTWKTVL
eukprot:1212603-Prymnesium_polylepis.1